MHRTATYRASTRARAAAVATGATLVLVTAAGPAAASGVPVPAEAITTQPDDDGDREVVAVDVEGNGVAVTEHDAGAAVTVSLASGDETDVTSQKVGPVAVQVARDGAGVRLDLTSNGGGGTPQPAPEPAPEPVSEPEPVGAARTDAHDAQQPHAAANRASGPRAVTPAADDLAAPPALEFANVLVPGVDAAEVLAAPALPPVDGYTLLKTLTALLVAGAAATWQLVRRELA